jgi:hypothetical protein
MQNRHRLTLLAAVLLTTACNKEAERLAQARADSLEVATAEQLRLTTALSAQKDSLTRIIFDADDFIVKIDSQIRTVKGMPKAKRGKTKLESPMEEQIQRRKETLARVEALVARTKQTAAQLADSRRREQKLKGENAQLQARIEEDQKMIAELGETVQRQLATIADMEVRIDSLEAETMAIGTVHYRAYYVVGTEKELLKKGVIVREGGANLLVARPGRTLLPARKLDPAVFTQIDQREVREIPLPDSTKRYRLVSRQNLDAAEVAERDKATIRDSKLKITDRERFWGDSRYLILVQR